MPQPQPPGVTVEIKERRADKPGRTPDGETYARAGFEVTINGTPIGAPVVAYEVLSGDRDPVVTLTIPVDRVTVGVRPVDTAQARAGFVWGGAGRPDPRESIPGWTPEVAATDA